ncbi:MAG TPA: hypothetical protein VNS12_02420 [Pelagibacterium sp.]|uniref:hypothetical protein n=1 Tax=Pelagibacterium sp. TaxID=1967288 RepID=UPI002D060E4A|nr:hypothetical protein [Pelagibacterium sp.]HWJ86907.1 hypothetical protein [Pelagibacterium sp.]
MTTASWAQLQRRRAGRLNKAPDVSPLDRPVSGALVLRPNEDHWLRLEVNGVGLMIHQGQMARLEALFAAARGEINADGFRGSDRLHMHTIKLGGF